MEEFFNKALTEYLEQDWIAGFKLEFRLANNSSLDYAAILDVTGKAAHAKQVLERLVNKVGVDACNEFDLGIPFQQITLHRAN